MDKEKEQQKIDIHCIVRDVMKDIWVAVIIGISAAFLAYVWAGISYRPVYTSQTTFVVSAKGSTMGAYANMTKTQKLTDIFQSVMDSQILKKKVSDKIGLESFPGTVSIAVVPETNLLTVAVTADSPDMALRLLKNMLECYPEVGENVLGEVVMEIFEEPGYPSVPNNRFEGRAVMKKAFLIGFLLMAGLIAIISYMKDTVKNEKEISRKLDTVEYGVLHHEKKYKNLRSFLRRKKKRILLTEPSVSFGYAETMKKIRTKLLYQMKKKKAKVVMVTSAMPGEGKTTTAMNLAQALAQNSRKVLLIEGNLRESGLAKSLQMNDRELPNWGTYLKKDGTLTDAIIQPEGCGFQLMVNGVKIARATELLASKKMNTFMEQMREEMDVIIIDAPHVKNRSDTEVLARISDLSLLVVKQNHTLTKYINDSIDMLNGYGEGVAGCILNDVLNRRGVLSLGYGYGYGYSYGYGYGKYRRYGQYGKYGKYGYYNHYNSYRKTAEKELKNE